MKLRGIGDGSLTSSNYEFLIKMSPTRLKYKVSDFFGTIFSIDKDVYF